MKLPRDLNLLIGKSGHMAESTAVLFAHEAERLSILFVRPDDLAEYLTENYTDETEESLECAEAGEWSDETFVPFAVIADGGTTFGEGDERFDDVFAFLFWDAEENQIVWATTDDWDRANTIDSLDELEIEFS